MLLITCQLLSSFFFFVMFVVFVPFSNPEQLHVVYSDERR